MNTDPPVFVSSTGVAVPPGRLTVEELPDQEQLSPPESAVLTRLGVDTVAVAAADTLFDLQVSAGRDALAAGGIEGGALDAVVTVASRAPHQLMTSESTRLQEALGASDALAFSVGDLGCAGMAAAIDVSRSLLIARPRWNHILIAHTSSPVGRNRYRHPVTVNGDAACALVLSRDGGWRVDEVALQTNGRYWDLYSVDYRGRSDSEWVEACADLREYSFGLAVESRNRFRDVIASLGGLEDVSAVLLQHLSQAAFDLYEESLGVTVDPVCREHTRTLGHLGSMDMVLDLHELTRRPTGVGRVLALANSPVAAWGGVVLEGR